MYLKRMFRCFLALFLLLAAGTTLEFLSTGRAVTTLVLGTFTLIFLAVALRLLAELERSRGEYFQDQQYLEFTLMFIGFGATVALVMTGLHALWGSDPNREVASAIISVVLGLGCFSLFLYVSSPNHQFRRN